MSSPGEAPVVFVVDDDVSVRESLELLIRSAGWHAETFASAEDFLARSHIDGPSCLVLDVSLPNPMGSISRNELWIEQVCRSSSLPATATYRPACRR